MPSIEDYKQYLIRADYGLVFLVMLTALCVAITILLWRRWPRFRVIAPLIGWPAIVGGFFLANPLLAGIGATWPIAFLTSKRKLLNLPSLLIGALLLRLPLMFMSFWYDEAFTARMASLSWSQLWPAIQADVHPPPYYVLIWLWSRIVGHSEFMLRLPSLAFGMLSLYLLYRLVKVAGLSESVALIAALLCAVTPSAIYYSTELRSYSIMLCAVFGALICILEDRPIGFIICTVLIAWFHNLGLLYVPVLCLLAYLYRQKSWQAIMIHRELVTGVIQSDLFILRYWRLSLLTTLVLSIVWLPLAIQQSHSITDGFWIYFDAGTPLWTLTLNLMYLPREYIIPLMLPYIALTALTFWIARRWLLSAAGRLVLILVVAVPMLAVLVSLLWAPIYLPRLFLPVTLLALIPLAYALQSHRHVVGAVALPLLIGSLLVFYSNVALIRPDYRSMLAQGCADSSAIYFTAIDTAITFAPDTDLPALVWPGSSDRGDTFLPGQLHLFNFEEGEISALKGQTVCLAYIFTPRTLQSEREKVAQILATYEYDGVINLLHSELEVDFYQLRIPENG